MKKLVATFCIVGSAITLAACGSTGTANTEDTAVPYTTARTAGYADDPAPAVERTAPVRAERVFRAQQTK